MHWYVYWWNPTWREWVRHWREFPKRQDAEFRAAEIERVSNGNLPTCIQQVTEPAPTQPPD